MKDIMYSLNNEEKKKKANDNYLSNSFNGGFEQSPSVYDDGLSATETGFAQANNQWDAFSQGGYDEKNSVANRVKQQHLADMMLVATPERIKGIYARSPRALNDFAETYYNQTVRPVFEDNKKKKIKDPFKVIDKTVSGLDDGHLQRMAEPLARDGGFDAGQYTNDFVKPALHDKMIEEYIKEKMPKGHGDYILKSTINNSLLGKGFNYAFRDKNDVLLENEALARYDANWFDRLASGVGSLLVDAPAFYGAGSVAGKLVGGATNLATRSLASRIYSYGAADGISKAFASKMAERAIVGKLGNRMMQSAATQGLTLGTYDVAHSIADDILYDSGVDGGKAAGAFARGFITGGTVGAVGAGLRGATRGLTGGRKMMASAGVLSAESAVFTASGEMQKVYDDIEIEPIDIVNDFLEGTATLGVMKMTHWRPKGGNAKLNEKGKLRDELKLSRSEMEELRELNVEPEEFMEAVERNLRLPNIAAPSTLEQIYDNYLKLMSNSELSASAKSKLMYIIDNKVTSTPPVPFDYRAYKNSSGRWVLNTFDAEGRLLERNIYPHSGVAYNKMLVECANIRRNRISAFENELLQGVDSQNFLRQAGLYAQEKGIAADDLASILYRRAKKEPLAPWEEGAVNDILERSTYEQTGMVQMLADKRRALESDYGLQEGALLTKINEPFYMCNEAENAALNAYEHFVRREVETLKKGTDEVRKQQLAALAADSPYKGMSNDEVKHNEVQDFYRAHPEKQGPSGSGNFKEKPIEIEDEGDPEYVWNYEGNNITRTEIENYKEVAQKLADKFNAKVDFISDEREIPLPDANDKYDVANYNNRVMSLGWLDSKGRITINLPNIASVEELEKTFVHETVAHDGFNKLFGNHLNTFLEEVYRKASPDVREGIERVHSKYRRFKNMYISIEEYLAELSEKANLTSEERSLKTSFKDFIRGSLLRLNIYTGRNRRITEQDLIGLIRQHAKYISKNVAPADYRKRVFGGFEAAKMDERTYSDRAAYADDVRARLKEGNYLRRTPNELYDHKAYRHYELMPEDMQETFRRRWNTTDEFIRNQKGDDHFRFIGEKGANNLAYYEGRDVDVNLASAKAMHQRGESPRLIKQLTGWELGPDEMWRMEMPDNRLRVNDQLYNSLLRTDEKLAKRYQELREVPIDSWDHNDFFLWGRIKDAHISFPKGMNLRDVLHEPSFFATYPELATLPVEIVSDANIACRYDNKNKKILLDRSFFISPNNARQMSGVLQNVIQDYEGFSKAVSLNLMAVNTRLGQSYNEAINVIKALEKSKREVPSFDAAGAIDKVFKQQYGFAPREFKLRFPSVDEYIIYRLTHKNLSFSGNVEARNVEGRYGISNHNREFLAGDTEDVPRDRQMVIKKFDDLKKYFTGPLDVIYRWMQNNVTDNKLHFDKDFKRPRRSELSPLERADYEWESSDRLEREIENLQKVNNYGNYDHHWGYGYDRFKEWLQERKDKRKREKNYEDLKKIFPNFKLDPDNKN